MKVHATIIAAAAASILISIASCAHDGPDLPVIGSAAQAEATTGKYAMYISPEPNGPFPSILWAEDSSLHTATIAYLPNGASAVTTVASVPKCALLSAPSAADFGDMTTGNTNVGVYYLSTDSEVRAPALFTSRDDAGAWSGTAYGPNAPDGGAFVGVQQTQPDFGGIDPVLGCWFFAATRY